MSKRFSKGQSKALNKILEIRGASEEYPVDPRTVQLNPKKHTKEQLEQHYLLCEDIDLLAKTLGPDEWDDDL